MSRTPDQNGTANVRPAVQAYGSGEFRRDGLQPERFPGSGRLALVSLVGTSSRAYNA